MSERNASGYSTVAKSGRTFAGYGIVCEAEPHLALDFDPEGRQDKIPYPTEADARRRLDIIERMGFCRGEHRIVAVWATYPGRNPKGGR